MRLSGSGNRRSALAFSQRERLGGALALGLGNGKRGNGSGFFPLCNVALNSGPFSLPQRTAKSGEERDDGGNQRRAGEPIARDKFARDIYPRRSPCRDRITAEVGLNVPAQIKCCGIAFSRKLGQRLHDDGIDIASQCCGTHFHTGAGGIIDADVSEHRAGSRGHVLYDGFEQCERIASDIAERGNACQHAKERGAQPVDVGGNGDRLALHLLRTRILGGQYPVVPLGQRAGFTVVGEQLGDSEVQ